MDILMKKKKRSHWKLAVLSALMVSVLLTENVLSVSAADLSGTIEGSFLADSGADGEETALNDAEGTVLSAAEADGEAVLQEVDADSAEADLAGAGASDSSSEEAARAGDSCEPSPDAAEARDAEAEDTEDLDTSAEETAVTEDVVEDILSEQEQAVISAAEEEAAQDTEEAYDPSLQQEIEDEIILVPEEGALSSDGQQDAKDGWGEILEEDQILLASSKNIPQGVWISGVKTATYTGREITFDLNVYDENLLLTEGVDYTISYSNNIVAATSDSTLAPTILLTGKGNYSGEFQTRFTISPKAISSSEITADDLYMARTGEVLDPVPEVYDADLLLENKTDYVFAVKTTKNASTDPVEKGTYNIELTGIGNYTGTKTIRLYVTESTLITDLELAPLEAMNYTGSALKPEPVLTHGGKQLTKGKDYTVEYKNNTDAGTATVKITGKGNYAGIRTETFEIVGVELSEVEIYNLSDSYYYTGSEITPSVQLIYSEGEGAAAQSAILKEKKDYTVTYADNKEVGLATITIQGKGRYLGSVTKTFWIEKYDFNSEDGNLKITAEVAVTYAKGGCTPPVTITYYGKELKEGTDYTLKYSNYKKALDTENPPTITITGTGNYTGTLTRNFVIEKQDISNVEILAPDKAYGKTASSVLQTKTLVLYDLDGGKLKKNKDYTITGYYYKNLTTLEDGTIKSAGTEVNVKDRPPLGTEIYVEVAGIGNYQGTARAEYKIVTNDLVGSETLARAIDLSNAKVRISMQTYTGQAITLSNEQIAVRLSGKYLRQTDFEIVSYTNNIETGTARVLLHGIGSYGGYVVGKFKIGLREIQGNSVTFDGNGATSGAMEVLRVSSMETDAALYTNAYTKNGCEFAGWNTKPDGSGTAYKDGGKITFPANKNGVNIVLYAQWTPNTYTITYYLNGGVNSSENPTTYLYNSGTVTFQDPERAGYDFAGWYSSKNFSGRRIEISAGTKKNITLYAKWKVKAPSILLSEKTSEGNRIVFQPVTGASKYEVYRSTTYGGSYRKIGTTTSSTYVDKKAESGKTYYYKIRAYSKEKSSSGYGAYSSIVAVGSN